MSIALEMRQSIAALAGPRAESDTRESMIDRAARRAGISYRQAKALYYGETRDPRAFVVERIRTAVTIWKDRQEAAAHASTCAALARLEMVRASLAAADPAFHRQEIARLEHVIGDLRRGLAAPVSRS